MPPTLRKRKALATEPAAVPPAKKMGVIGKAIEKVQEATKPAPKVETTSKVTVGDIIDLEGFGGDIEMNDGRKTTLKSLVDGSKGGVVLFTYPAASTPGCE